MGEYFNGGFLDAAHNQAASKDAPFGSVTKITMSRIASFLSIDDINYLSLQDEEGDVKEDGASDVRGDESEVGGKALGKRRAASYDDKREEGADKRSRGAAEESDYGNITDDGLGFLVDMDDEAINVRGATDTFNLAGLYTEQGYLFFADGFHPLQQAHVTFLGGNGSFGNADDGASESGHGSMSDIE